MNEAYEYLISEGFMGKGAVTALLKKEGHIPKNCSLDEALLAESLETHIYPCTTCTRDRSICGGREMKRRRWRHWK